MANDNPATEASLVADASVLQSPNPTSTLTPTPTPAPPPKTILDRLNGQKNVPLFLAAFIAVVGVSLYTCLARWSGVVLIIPAAGLSTVLSPLFITAAFIERGVEVLISPWRDAGAAKRENAMDAAKAKTPPDATEVAATIEAFQDYKAITQRYAFCVSLTLALSAAAVGLRGFWPLVEQTSFNKLDPHQRWMFLVVDVVISATLLAGGADGIHSVTNAFTTFFSATAQKTQQIANTPPPKVQ